MKLTNLQLDIISNEIREQLIKNKLTEAVKSEIKNKIVTDDKVVTIKNLIKEYNANTEVIESLRKKNLEISQIINKNLTELDLKNISCYNIVGYKRDIEDIIITREFDKLIPSLKEIQTKIILKNINGSKDIINDILNDY